MDALALALGLVHAVTRNMRLADGISRLRLV